MVWHETRTTAVIIMLTKAVEHGKVNSIQYFPLGKPLHDPKASYTTFNHYLDTESSDNFEATLEIMSMAESSSVGTTLRSMDLRVRQGAPLNSLVPDSKIGVRHYHFEGWMDHTVPQGSNRDSLVELCKISRKDEIEFDGAPRIVHCGAGSGRTGTFIALDFLLGELENGTMADCDGKSDLIFNTVDSLRKQRMLMVQTIDLYQFLYHTLKDELSKKFEIEANLMEASRQAYQFYPYMGSVRYKFIVSNDALTGDSPWIVKCAYLRGQKYEITRSFREFYDLSERQHVSSLHYVLREYDSNRMPALPNPDNIGDIWTAREQESYLDNFVKKLLASPFYRHAQLTDIHNFFSPREGDVEVPETAAEASEDEWSGSHDGSEQDHVQLLEKHTTAGSQPQEPPKNGDHIWWTPETYEKALPTMQLESSRRNVANDTGNPTIPFQPTYVKVHERHVAIATLDYYQLPWERDLVSIDDAQYYL